MKTIIQLLFFTLIAFGLTAAEPTKLVQIRLVQDSTDADTEEMTLIHSTKEKEWTVSLHVQKEPVLDLRAVASARLGRLDISGRPQIEITLTEKGRETFAEVTRKNIGRQLAIILDGRLMSAPNIADQILGGKLAIPVNLSLEEAEELATKINTAAAKE